MFIASHAVYAAPTVIPDNDVALVEYRSPNPEYEALATLEDGRLSCALLNRVISNLNGGNSRQVLLLTPNFFNLFAGLSSLRR